jgi:DNA (cytosine-5)-methyltransferase 1
MGYHLAGFDVTGVDLVDQPRYPFEFHQGDALAYLAEHGQEFDAIHASPPCQAYTSLSTSYAADAEPHPELVDPTRNALIALGRPWIMENVPGAPMPAAVMLCGTMFGLGIDGLQLRRHRLFEHHPAVPAWPPYSCAHRGGTVGLYGDHLHGPAGAQYPDTARVALGSAVLGVDWMEWHGLTQAIPPAYTEHLGAALLAVL